VDPGDTAGTGKSRRHDKCTHIYALTQTLTGHYFISITEKSLSRLKREREEKRERRTEIERDDERHRDRGTETETETETERQRHCSAKCTSVSTTGISFSRVDAHKRDRERDTHTYLNHTLFCLNNGDLLDLNAFYYLLDWHCASLLHTHEHTQIS